MTDRNTHKPSQDSGFADTAAHRYARELHRFIARRLRRPQDIDDVAQEVYLRLLRLGDEQRVRKPLAFLYGVAAHVVADFKLGVSKEQAYVSFDDENATERSERPSEVLPDELGERVALEQYLSWALTQLPPTHAAVLLARKRDGLSRADIARRFGLSMNTVEKYLTQAKAKIRTLSWNG